MVPGLRSTIPVDRLTGESAQTILCLLFRSGPRPVHTNSPPGGQPIGSTANTPGIASVVYRYVIEPSSSPAPGSGPCASTAPIRITIYRGAIE